MFYDFHQNNSGGDFQFDPSKGISVNVIIEADTPEEANRLAEEKGIYFDGCYKGLDCPCCGDRWYPVDDYDEYKVPSIYNTPVDEYEPLIKWIEGPDVFVHFKDGTVKGYAK